MQRAGWVHDGAVNATGFRVHLGWADAVTLTDVPARPRVVDRRRIDFRPVGALAFPYHVAREAAPEEREAIIVGGLEAAEAAATGAFMELSADLGIDRAGVVVSRSVHRIPVGRILANSQLFHTAEGEIYQKALRAAIANVGLAVVTIRFGDAEANECWAAVTQLGRQVGPPWRKDHKLAAAAAWVAATARIE